MHKKETKYIPSTQNMSQKENSLFNISKQHKHWETNAFLISQMPNKINWERNSSSLSSKLIPTLSSNYQYFCQRLHFYWLFCFVKRIPNTSVICYPAINISHREKNTIVKFKEIHSKNQIWLMYFNWKTEV